MEKADETHFVFNMDNDRTVGLQGDVNVKYADVVSGDEGITMMVRITDGARVFIQPPMLVFKNDNNSYPIRGVSDDFPGVCYHMGKRRSMDKRVFKEWLSEPQSIWTVENGMKRVLYVDNCSGHNQNEEGDAFLAKINTELRKLPPNATDLVQPGDSFVIVKVKDAWRREWDSYKSGELYRGRGEAADHAPAGNLKFREGVF